MAEENWRLLGTLNLDMHCELNNNNNNIALTMNIIVIFEVEGE